MKKLFVLLSAIFIAIGITSCGFSSAQELTDGFINEAVLTDFRLADFPIPDCEVKSGEDKAYFNMTDEEYEQLGRWEVEDQFREILMSYLALDEYGKTAVESLIKAEKLRCHEQQSLCSTDGIVLSIRITK